eukprot:m51a1_g1436 hypothetical protein (526) ;mRNA; r:109744-111804
MQCPANLTCASPALLSTDPSTGRYILAVGSQTGTQLFAAHRAPQRFVHLQDISTPCPPAAFEWPLLVSACPELVQLRSASRGFAVVAHTMTASPTLHAALAACPDLEYPVAVLLSASGELSTAELSNYTEGGPLNSTRIRPRPNASFVAVAASGPHVLAADTLGGVVVLSRTAGTGWEAVQTLETGLASLSPRNVSITATESLLTLSAPGTAMAWRLSNGTWAGPELLAFLGGAGAVATSRAGDLVVALSRATGAVAAHARDAVTSRWSEQVLAEGTQHYGVGARDPYVVVDSSNGSSHVVDVYVPAVCGDGRIEVVKAVGGAVILAEQCDDGGNLSGDGCSSNCTLEDGWRCHSEPSRCLRVCAPVTFLDVFPPQCESTGSVVFRTTGHMCPCNYTITLPSGAVIVGRPHEAIVLGPALYTATFTSANCTLDTQFSIDAVSEDCASADEEDWKDFWLPLILIILGVLAAAALLVVFITLWRLKRALCPPCKRGRKKLKDDFSMFDIEGSGSASAKGRAAGAKRP